MAKKIIEGSRVIIYRMDKSSFPAPYLEKHGRDLIGRMDTVIRIEGKDSCYLESGWAVSRSCLKKVI